MKEFIGTCVSNPFATMDILRETIDNAKSISKRCFMSHCNVPDDIKTTMKRFPRDYKYYKYNKIMFYTWYSIEHFFTDNEQEN